MKRVIIQAVLISICTCYSVCAQQSVTDLIEEGESYVLEKKNLKAIKCFEQAEEQLRVSNVSLPTTIRLYDNLYRINDRALKRKKASHYLELLTEQKIKLKNKQLKLKNRQLKNKDSLVVNLEEQYEQTSQLYEETSELYEQQSEISEEQSEKIEDLERSQLISRMRLFEDSLRIAFKNSEIREKETLVALEKAKTKQSQSIVFAVTGILGLIIVLFLMSIRSRKVIAAEKKKSDELLLNILPVSIADELKKKGKVAPQRHPEATILFSDFVGFSKVAEVLDQDQLVALIDEYFRAFDDITKSHGIEKIKTIGDAYMCVCGVPNTNSNHAKQMMKAAIEIQYMIDSLRVTKMMSNSPFFDLRIGIQSGEVIAGVVGRDKYAYDVWGKSVNLAARIESVCPPGCIAVSRETKALLGKEYVFSEVLRMDVKNTKNVEAHIYDLK